MTTRRWAVLCTAFLLAGSMTATITTATAQTPIPPSEVSIGLEVFADGFTTPVWGTTAPGNAQQLFVVDQVGKVWAIARNPGRHGRVPDRQLFLDVGTTGQNLIVPLGAFGPGSFDERGLLGLAFHPDYAANGRVYTYTSEPVRGAADFSTIPVGTNPNHQAVIREWTVAEPRRPGAVIDPSSSRVLFTVDEPQFNHNAGALAFDPDGNLYIGLGDGGGSDDQGVGHAEGGNGQSLAPGNVLGKILRIDPLGSNSANGRYGIPADNPFVGTAAPDEIYAYGLRNPYRFSFDHRTKELYVADVGQNNIEEVNIVTRGGNYGWPVKEGTWLFDNRGSLPGTVTVRSPGVPAGLIDPIAEYDHTEGISITGGFVYRGSEIPELYGSYLFGDFNPPIAGVGGRVFHLGPDHSIKILESFPLLHVTGFGQDASGEMYVMGTNNTAPVGTTGVVLKIVPSG